MLQQEKGPDAVTRTENLEELLNAAVEAKDRGETASDFLDHAALVAQTDDIDEAAQVSLLTIHNAKGLEFPFVFLAGMEEGLFPHSRSIGTSEAALEEERRLCYVGMTRAEKRLTLTWARYRRRYGGGEAERTLPSRFLDEIPKDLVVDFGEDARIAQVDLFAERHDVRQAARRSTFTGSRCRARQYAPLPGLRSPPRQAPSRITVASCPAPPASVCPTIAHVVTHGSYTRRRPSQPASRAASRNSASVRYRVSAKSGSRDRNTLPEPVSTCRLAVAMRFSQTL
jgi:hypothetical protein